MTAPDTRPGLQPGQPRDADHWARYVETLRSPASGTVRAPAMSRDAGR
jgi:hypothetical protein